MKVINDDKWFICKSGIAPIYFKSTFESECVTELVFGESCLVLNIIKNWVKIRTDDEYEGFVNLFYGLIDLKRNNKKYCVVEPNTSGLFNPKYPFGSIVSNNVEGAVKKKRKIQHGLDNSHR